MNENKLTDEEIVKALEWCGTKIMCNGCPKYGGEVVIDYHKCKKDLIKQSIDLIHRLQAENAELQKQADKLKKDREALFNEMSERMKVEVAIEKKLGIRKCEQAVKDRTKEIFEWLEKHCFFNGFEIVETYFKERYGVEV